MLALNAFLGVTASVIMSSLRQAIVPDHLLGRVNSVMTFAGSGIGLTAGSLTGGLLATALGIGAPFLISAALIAAACVFVPRISRTLRQAAVA
ncbi:MAG: hypothetical protein JWN00_788 [Actinomycetia bacterium]|jgi:MFS family permease|nr:hypothetical protein [Actinomycetes bacterium]